MMLHQKLKRVGQVLSAVAENCFHYYRAGMEAPYIVWSEEGETNSITLDNVKTSQTIGGTIDYYTRTEYDPTAEEIQTALVSLQQEMPFEWSLGSVQYETETKLIHWQWEFRI